MLGDEVAYRIKEIDGTKIILISAYDLDATTINNLKTRNGIEKVLKKPIGIRTLVSEIEHNMQ